MPGGVLESGGNLREVESRVNSAKWHQSMPKLITLGAGARAGSPCLHNPGKSSANGVVICFLNSDVRAVPNFGLKERATHRHALASRAAAPPRGSPRVKLLVARFRFGYTAEAWSIVERQPGKSAWFSL